MVICEPVSRAAFNSAGLILNALGRAQARLRRRIGLRLILRNKWKSRQEDQTGGYNTTNECVCLPQDRHSTASMVAPFALTHQVLFGGFEQVVGICAVVRVARDPDFRLKQKCFAFLRNLSFDPGGNLLGILLACFRKNNRKLRGFKRTPKTSYSRMVAFKICATSGSSSSVGKSTETRMTVERMLLALGAHDFLAQPRLKVTVNVPDLCTQDGHS